MYMVSKFYVCPSISVVVTSFDWVMAMVFNATFNTISVISWWSVLLKETGVPGKNHRPTTSH